jgi:hypothetical protein
MRKIINYFKIGLAIMIILTSLLGLLDDAIWKTGIWYKDIFGYIRYYILWGLPYWWLIILIGAVIISLISYGIQAVINKLRQ